MTPIRTIPTKTLTRGIPAILPIRATPATRTTIRIKIRPTSAATR